MRKNVKKKDEEENWRIGKENAVSEMEEKREAEWKTATREKEGNVKEYWRNHHNGVIGIWRGREEWGWRKKKWKRREKGVEIQEKEEQLMINSNEMKSS